jgi:hypothetical protein
MPIEQFKYGIVGFGISGQLLVCELLKQNISSKDIVVLDKTFCGGALSTEYGSVMSNTQWWKTKKVLKAYEPWSTKLLEELDTKIQETQCTPVRQIANACYTVAMEAAKQVEKKTTTVKYIQKTDACWRIQHSFGTVEVHTLFLCPGGQPKCLDTCIPQIPLPIALHKQKLANIVSKQDTVIVFGTSHSGTICLSNLHALGIPAIGVYKNSVPFTFVEEGAYDGLKEESAKIAKDILAGAYTNTTLIPWSEPLQLHKYLKSATKSICATGFQAEAEFCQDFRSYDPATGKVSNQPKLYGFGLAYPGVSVLSDKTYVDVSVLSFQEQIQRCLPAALLE